MLFWIWVGDDRRPITAKCIKTHATMSSSKKMMPKKGSNEKNNLGKFIISSMKKFVDSTGDTRFDGRYTIFHG